MDAPCNIQLMDCINKVVNNGIKGNIKQITDCKNFIKNIVEPGNTTQEVIPRKEKPLHLERSFK